jgi:hypothetical protein
VVLYVGLVAFIAHATGFKYLLFPELGAISYDVLKRPAGPWAKAPVLLVVTPFVTGLVGVVVTRRLPYGLVSVLLTVASALVVIRLLRSPFTPAISAGLLPLTLGLTSRSYPPGLLVGTVVLAVLLVCWKRVTRKFPELTGPTASTGADVREDEGGWLPVYLLFLAASVTIVVLTGWRFVLYPPLAVIALEMFRHPQRCPWAGRPLALPLAFACSAGGGVFLANVFHGGPIGAACSAAFSIVVLRVFDLYAPPALAIGLLPFIIQEPRYRFAVEVGLGTLFATLLFTSWRRITRPPPRATRDRSCPEEAASEKDCSARLLPACFG